VRNRYATFLLSLFTAIIHQLSHKYNFVLSPQNHPIAGRRAFFSAHPAHKLSPFSFITCFKVALLIWIGSDQAPNIEKRRRGYLEEGAPLLEDFLLRKRNELRNKTSFQKTMNYLRSGVVRTRGTRMAILAHNFGRSSNGQFCHSG
jgi:hypothetical protein